MEKNDQILNDILETVNFIKDNAATKEQVDKMDERLDKMEGRLDKMDSRLTRVESQMVTKEYLDEKLSDLKGDLTIIIRKEDTKLKALVEILAERKIITAEDKKRVLNMEPFPSLSL